MPRNNILGLHLDILRREAHVVLGRKQAIFEVGGAERAAVAAQPARNSQSALTGQWPLDDGYTSVLEASGLKSSSLEGSSAAGDGRPVRAAGKRGLADLKDTAPFGGRYWWTIAGRVGLDQYGAITTRHECAVLPDETINSTPDLVPTPGR